MSNFNLTRLSWSKWVLPLPPPLQLQTCRHTPACQHNHCNKQVSKKDFWGNTGQDVISDVEQHWRMYVDVCWGRRRRRRYSMSDMLTMCSFIKALICRFVSSSPFDQRDPFPPLSYDTFPLVHPIECTFRSLFFQRFDFNQGPSFNMYM